MVHPLVSKLVFAARPTALGACPPDWSKVPLICPAVSKLLNILSIEIEDKFVFLKASVKSVAVQLSKYFFGKEINELQ